MRARTPLPSAALASSSPLRAALAITLATWLTAPGAYAQAQAPSTRQVEAHALASAEAVALSATRSAIIHMMRGRRAIAQDAVTEGVVSAADLGAGAADGAARSLKIVDRSLLAALDVEIARMDRAAAEPQSQARAQERCADYLPSAERWDGRLLAMRGVACFEADQFARALDFYRRAQQLGDDPVLDAALGRAWDELGALDLASAYYRRYLRRAPPQDIESRDRIWSRLRRVELMLGSGASVVDVALWPSQADVWLVLPDAQRELLGQTPIQLRFKPGRYVLQVERPGYYSERLELELFASQHLELSRSLIPQDQTFQIEDRSWRRAGLLTMAAGIPLLASGGVLWATGRSNIQQAREPSQHPSRLETGYTQQRWGVGLLIVGGATLLTGGALWLVGSGDDARFEPTIAPSSSESPSLSVAPGWVELGWAF